MLGGSGVNVGITLFVNGQSGPAFVLYDNYTSWFCSFRVIAVRVSLSNSPTFYSNIGHKKPHFGELHFKEDVHKLELTSQADEGETRETNKTKKMIDLKGISVKDNYFFNFVRFNMVF